MADRFDSQKLHFVPGFYLMKDLSRLNIETLMNLVMLWTLEGASRTRMLHQRAFLQTKVVQESDSKHLPEEQEADSLLEYLIQRKQ